MNFSRRNNRNPGSRVALGAIVVLCLVSIILWSGEGSTGFFHSAQHLASALVAPISTSSASDADDASDDNMSEESVSALREQNESLTQQVATAEEYRQEAERLQELLDLKDEYEIDGVSARVVGRTTDGWNQTVTIDVGESGGSFVGATVCASYGVIGQVISVTNGSSVVRLLTDPQSGVAAMIQSSRVNCVVKGSLDGLITAENLPTDSGIQVGDIIITSGLGGSFTKGLIIGTVTRTTGSASDGTLKAYIKQNDTTNFEEVIIVKDATAED